MLDRKQVTLLLFLLVGTGLLFFQPEGLSFSVDEFRNVDTDSHSLVEITNMLVEGGHDLHPPLTHWLSHLWMCLFGESEWALRSIWASAGVLTLALTYRLGAMLNSPAAGLLGSALLATLSTFLLYTRFVKYYAFTMLMALALTLAFFYLLRRRTPARLALYLVLLTLFLYGDYFGPVLCVLWQDLFLLVRSLRKRAAEEWKLFATIVGVQAVAGILWLPWINGAFLQTNRVFSMSSADIGQGALSFLLRIAHAVYSFTLGETLFPWRVAAFLGFAGAIGALLASLNALYRDRSRLALWTGSFSLLTIGLIGVLTSTLITGVPFVSFAKHIIFALPFFTLWLSSGLMSLQHAGLRWFLVGCLLIAHLAGLINYFTRQEFHNPIYAVPTREVVKQLAEEASSEDLVLAASDIGVDFYATRTPGWAAPVAETSDEQALKHRIRTEQPHRVWLFIFGRDRTRGARPTELHRWLESHYRLMDVRGYAKQAPVYRRIKEILFRRSAYRHKLTLYVYERP